MLPSQLAVGQEQVFGEQVHDARVRACEALNIRHCFACCRCVRLRAHVYVYVCACPFLYVCMPRVGVRCFVMYGSVRVRGCEHEGF